MSFYTVRRDDSELRVVICPKCKNADVTKFQDVIPYKLDNWLLRLMQCNKCHTYFSFYREDGVKEISENMAIDGLKKNRLDMTKNGEDCHGHSFYIIFKNKPLTMSAEQYDELCGFTKDKNDEYCGKNKQFDRWVERIPSVNQLVRYRNMINNIDFDSMTYLDDHKNEWFG